MSEVLGQEIDKAIKDETFFEWLSAKLQKRWYPAMVSMGVTPGVVRIQLQSEPPESEDTGEIKCVEGRSLLEAVQQAMKLAEVADG